MKKTTYRLSFYYSTFSPQRLNVSVYDNKNKTVESTFFEIDNITKVSEFIANNKTIVNEIFNLLNKLKDFDKDVDLILLDKTLNYSYISPNMGKSKVRMFLDKEIEENFENYESKYTCLTKPVTTKNGNIYHLASFLNHELVKSFDDIFKEAGLNLNHTYLYEHLYGDFFNRDIDDKNYVVLNIRNKCTSIMVMVNNELSDYYSFNTNLEDLDQIITKLYSVVYKHTYGFEKVNIKNLHISTNINLSDEIKDKFSHLDLLETTFEPFGIREFDRFKFSYVPRIKEKGKVQKNFLSFDLGTLFKKGFTLTECVVSLAILALVSASVYAGILLTNNIKNKEYEENYVSTTISNFSSCFNANPSDAINTILLAYDQTSSSDNVLSDVKNSINKTFYFDKDYKVVSSNDYRFSFDTTYTLNKVDEGTNLYSYNFKINSVKSFEKDLIAEAVSFKDIYVKK